MMTTRNARSNPHRDVVKENVATQLVATRRFFNDDVSGVVFWPRRWTSRARFAQPTPRRTCSEP